MNMFEYYGLFREEHNTDRLTSAETEIIEFLFDKYLERGKSYRYVSRNRYFCLHACKRDIP